MSREYRALGRALQPWPQPRRRSLLAVVAGWVFRHLPELLVVWLLVRAWQTVAGVVGPLWTNTGCLALGLGLVCWPRSRRWLLTVAGCVVTRARLRAAFAELRLTRRNGRRPFTVAMRPTPVGERVWLLCPLGMSAEDVADETDRLRAACFAREVRVSRDRRFSALVVVDVIRRDTLSARQRVASPLAEHATPRHADAASGLGEGR